MLLELAVVDRVCGRYTYLPFQRRPHLLLAQSVEACRPAECFELVGARHVGDDDVGEHSSHANFQLRGSAPARNTANTIAQRPETLERLMQTCPRMEVFAGLEIHV